MKLVALLIALAGAFGMGWTGHRLQELDRRMRALKRLDPDNPPPGTFWDGAMSMLQWTDGKERSQVP